MEKKKNPHEKHRLRMRARFDSGGFDNYRPHEVIEQLLFQCLPRINCNIIAHDLIDRFGTVGGVLSADRSELMKIRGIGPKSAAFIVSVKETMSERIRQQYRQMGKLNHEMITFLTDWFLLQEKDVVGIITCDEKGVFQDYRAIPFVYSPEMTASNFMNQMTGQLKPQEYYDIIFNGYCLASSEAYRLIDELDRQQITVIDIYTRNSCTLESLFYMNT